MDFRLRLLPILIAPALMLAACERPGDRAPPGYVDACYGGLRNMKRNLVLSDRRMTLTVHGEEKDWPLLGRIVSDVGTAQRLHVFDVSTSTPGYIRTLEVSACDASGLYVRIDKRIYTDSRANQGGDSIVTEVVTYRKDANWQPVAQALVAAFKTRWPGDVQVQNLPMIPADERALPDDVRAELARERASGTPPGR